MTESSTQLSVSILGNPQATTITVDGSMSFLQMMRHIQTVVNVEPRHMRLVFKKDNALIRCNKDPDRFRGFRDDRDVQWNLQLAKTPCSEVFGNSPVAEVTVICGHFGGPETHVLRPAFRLQDGTFTTDGMDIWRQIVAQEE